MKSMLSAAALAALIGMLGAPAFARDQLPYEAVQKLELKDGSIVYVFKDGKMAKEDRLGRPAHLKPGETLELKDGRQMKAVGNEVERLREHLQHDLKS